MVIRYLELIICITCTIMACIINTQIGNLLMYCWNSLLLLILGITQILRFVGQKIGYDTGVLMIAILGVGIPGFVKIDKILYFIGQKACTGTRVAIFTILGLEIPGFIEICQDGQPATPVVWGDFRTLIYIIAYAIMFFTQSHLIVGVACICTTIEILVDQYHLLPLKYDIVAACALFVFLLYRYTAIKPRIIYTWIANLLVYCWNSFLLLLLWITEYLSLTGQKIGNETAAVMIIIMGFGNQGFVRIGQILYFVGEKVRMGTRVAILTISRLEIPGSVEACQDNRPATPGLWGDYRTLLYVLASAFMIFTQSHLIVGVVCTCATMEILIDKYCYLPLEYVFSLATTLFVLVLYGYTAYTPVGAYRRRMRP